MGESNRHDEIQGQIIHEYDGIEEADNSLPIWWLITFYGAIAFAIVYYFHYHVFETGQGSLAVYQAELEELTASAGAEVTEEALIAMSEDASVVSEGQAVFTANCVACHGEQAQGTIGPNLTDAYWIHGGSATDIHNVVGNGVAAAGMPPWAASLGPDAVAKVVAYVLTLRDTNVAGKEPQGEPYGDAPAPAPAIEEGAEGAGEEGEAAPEAEGVVTGEAQADVQDDSAIAGENAAEPTE